MIVAQEPMAFAALAPEQSAYQTYAQGYAGQYVSAYAQRVAMHANAMQQAQYHTGYHEPVHASAMQQAQYHTGYLEPGHASAMQQAQYHAGYHEHIASPRHKAHAAAAWHAAGMPEYMQADTVYSPRAHRPTLPSLKDQMQVPVPDYAPLTTSNESLHLTPRTPGRGASAFPEHSSPQRGTEYHSAPQPSAFPSNYGAGALVAAPFQPTVLPPAMPQVMMPAQLLRQPSLPPVPVPAQIPQCHWAFTVRKQEQKFHRLQELTWLDKYYYDNNHQIQRLGFKFSRALDPTKTAQALKLAIEEYPVVGSKVVLHGDKHKFHYDAESVTVQLVHVEPEILDSMPHLEQLCDILCPRSPDQKQNALFNAFLFKTEDARHGSVLVCGFQHTMGDAMSYALFLKKWSDSYEQLSITGTEEPDSRMPPEVFTQYSLLSHNYQRVPNSPVYRHFSFSDQDLKAIKELAMEGCREDEVLSTNDILCAQCAVAVAPFRHQQWGSGNMYDLVRVFVLVDSRGRCAPAGAWGNHVVDVVIDFAWHELLQGTPASVLRAARKIRATLKEQMAMMASDPQRFNSDRANRVEVRKLFCWNSWARVGESLRAVHFRSAPPPPPPLIGQDSDSPSPDSSPESSISQPLHDAAGPSQVDAAPNLEEMRWFNASWFPDPETIVVEPAACVRPEQSDPRIVVHVSAPVATAAAELDALRRYWWGARVRED